MYLTVDGKGPIGKERLMIQVEIVLGESPLEGGMG